MSSVLLAKGGRGESDSITRGNSSDVRMATTRNSIEAKERKRIQAASALPPTLEQSFAKTLPSGCLAATTTRGSGAATVRTRSLFDATDDTAIALETRPKYTFSAPPEWYPARARYPLPEAPCRPLPLSSPGMSSMHSTRRNGNGAPTATTTTTTTTRSLSTTASEPDMSPVRAREQAYRRALKSAERALREHARARGVELPNTAATKAAVRKLCNRSWQQFTPEAQEEHLLRTDPPRPLQRTGEIGSRSLSMSTSLYRLHQEQRAKQERALPPERLLTRNNNNYTNYFATTSNTNNTNHNTKHNTNYTAQQYDQPPPPSGLRGL